MLSTRPRRNRRIEALSYVDTRRPCTLTRHHQPTHSWVDPRVGLDWIGLGRVESVGPGRVGSGRTVSEATVNHSGLEYTIAEIPYW